MQRRPAVAARSRVESSAHARIGRRQRREPAHQRAEIEHRAADQQRHPAARADRRDQFEGIVDGTVRPNTSPPGRRCRSGDAALRARSARSAWRCRCPCRDRPARNRRSRSRAATRARARARAPVLPVPVGPMMQDRIGAARASGTVIDRAGTAGRARPADERPGRPAVIALVAAHGASPSRAAAHSSRARSAAVGAHGRVAGHRAERAFEACARRAPRPRSREVRRARRAPARPASAFGSSAGTARTTSCVGPRACRPRARACANSCAMRLGHVGVGRWSRRP